MMHSFSLDPRDVLFFRDARPMGGADAGSGARLPRPDQLHSALLSAFLARWPQRQDWEGAKHTFRLRTKENREQTHDRNEDSTCRFGGLRVVGPFVADAKGEVFFPTPLDLGMRLVPLTGGTNLPAPLSMGFLPVTREKRNLPVLIPTSLYAEYLAGNAPATKDLVLPFAAERTVQTAIDVATGTAKDGQFFQAEYLRLAPGARLVFSAECVVHPKGGGGDVDVFARPDAPGVVQMGGQGGLAALAPTGFALPSAPDEPTRFVRWTLLSPALFHAGWRPGWVKADTGDVLLKNLPPRRPDESRQDWKARQNRAAPFAARLVAARIGKPVAFSGWDAIQMGPKPTQLAVPAGSCYVFACDTPVEAAALAAALSAPCPHSDFFGEKGFGLGACSFLPP